MKAFRFASIVLLLAATLLMVGCLEEKVKTGLVYAHAAHAKEIRNNKKYKDCKACHTLTADKADYTNPVHTGQTGCSSSQACHPGALPMEEIQPGKTCKECHTTNEGLMTHTKPRFDDVIFSHDRHGENVESHNFACNDCHEDINREKKFRGVTESIHSKVMDMETCMACHEDAGVSNACDSCHQNVQPDIKPDYHTASWNSVHGKVIKRYGSTVICQRCHEQLSTPGEDACNECHLDMKPKSHTLRWNKSEHGRSALRNRDSCATCHQSDFCSDCHTQTPTTHFQPNFMYDGTGHKFLARTKMRSCYTCHSFEPDCSECHSL